MPCLSPKKYSDSILKTSDTDLRYRKVQKGNIYICHTSNNDIQFESVV